MRVVLLLSLLLCLSVPVVRAQEATSVFEPAPCPVEYPPGHTVECGYVTVPELHGEPDGPMIQVMVAVFRSRSDNPLPDPFIYLQGGPGSSGMDRFATGMDRIFEMVLDQRGIGHAIPQLDCPERATAEDQLTGAHACYERLIGEGVNVAAYNTVESAQDVIAVADALGYERINLFGSSYGSTLAMTVMRHFPERLNTVILEGVTPPEVDLMPSFSTTFQQVWDRLVAACEASARCLEAYPDLNGTFLQLIRQYDAEPLTLEITHPVTGEALPATLRGVDLVEAVSGGMMNYQFVPNIPLMIYALANGQLDGVIAMGQQALANATVDTSAEGALLAMRCSDDVNTTTPELWQSSIDSIAPEFRAAFQDDLAYWTEACREWGTQLDPMENTPVVSDIPTLLLSGAFDPVTPPQWADATTQYLTHGYSFTFPATTHGVVADSCATSIVRGFLDDPYTQPNGTCIERQLGVLFARP